MVGAAPIAANSRAENADVVLGTGRAAAKRAGVPSLARALGGPNDLLSEARASTDAALVPTDRPPARVASLREVPRARGAPRVGEGRSSRSSDPSWRVEPASQCRLRIINLSRLHGAVSDHRDAPDIAPTWECALSLSEIQGADRMIGRRRTPRPRGSALCHGARFKALPRMIGTRGTSRPRGTALYDGTPSLPARLRPCEAVVRSDRLEMATTFLAFTYAHAQRAESCFAIANGPSALSY